MIDDIFAKMIDDVFNVYSAIDSINKRLKEVEGKLGALTSRVIELERKAEEIENNNKKGA